MKALLHRQLLFFVFIGVALLGSMAAWLVTRDAKALLIGYDAGVFAFMAVLLQRFSESDAAGMRARAAANEPDHATLMLLVLAIVAIVVTAVTQELINARNANGAGVLLAAITLTISWFFTNAIFTLHYAHLYYLPAADADAEQAGGLEFPGSDSTPDYWDFAYFSFVLGMTFQVSDVVITDKRIRRLALAHSVIAFVFNIAVIALSVSLVASAAAPAQG
ncbi:MAG: DUF1345 domain-containing protein [Sandarakinorhabdus sp.]|nr:DUF1345 domain-containing protein [Sandarakinorhabdus sp.]